MGLVKMSARMIENHWLTAPVDEQVLFETPLEQRWEAAAQLVGDFIQQAFGGATTYRLQLVPGTTSTLDLASHTTAELVPGTASPAQVDPATVTYTRSTTPILPPPPRDFVLHQKGEGDV